MQVTVISDNELKEELNFLQKGDVPFTTWIEDLTPLTKTDVCIDLLFTNAKGRIDQLQRSATTLVIVNDVNGSLKDLPPNFARINGWPTLLKKGIIECSCQDVHRVLIEEIFSLFGKRTEFVSDIKGFITARVISMIINEAYYSLEEDVSTKEEIDLAMKLGTNYPYGPFEWSARIGLKKIKTLLESLSKENPTYTPSELLKKEAATS